MFQDAELGERVYCFGVELLGRVRGGCDSMKDALQPLRVALMSSRSDVKYFLTEK